MPKLIHIEGQVIDSHYEGRRGRPMTKSLQQMFIESGGHPVMVGQHRVMQMDRVPVESGDVTIRFHGRPMGIHGVILKSAKGGISLSDGRSVKSVCVWDDPSLPREVMHHVECPDAELRVWNVYRITHTTGVVTEDYWTNNAGMVLVCEDTGRRRYKCSAGPGPFDPDQFEFEICW